MITKKEYQKTLIRMWDSVRNDSCKGRSSCDGVRCEVCPMKPICFDEVWEHEDSLLRIYDTIEFVEKWGKEHPICKEESELSK